MRSDSVPVVGWDWPREPSNPVISLTTLGKLPADLLPGHRPAPVRKPKAKAPPAQPKLAGSMDDLLDVLGRPGCRTCGGVLDRRGNCSLCGR